MEERVKKALLEHAFFRWESAAMIAGTLLLAAGEALFNFSHYIHPAMIVSAGTILEAFLVYISLKDPATGQQVVEKMLQDEFKPARLKSPSLQKKIKQALEYRSRIESAIRIQPDGTLKNNLQDTASQIDDWLTNIYSLAQRLDRQRPRKRFVKKGSQPSRKKNLTTPKKITK